jgi:glycosyltransferase involved in cell wall biosynthesis
MPYHILFISSWYPTSEKKSHGIFFKRHAEAAALRNMISAIHVCSGAINNYEVTLDNNVFSIIGTYKKVNHQIPLISSIQKLLRSLHCFIGCYRLLLKENAAPNLVLLNVIFPAGIFALWLYYFKKIPFIIQEQWSGYYPEDGSYRGYFTKKITELCVKKAKAILVVSSKLEQCMKAHGLNNKYIKIGNVVDTDLFIPMPNHEFQVFKFVHVSTVNDKEKNITGIIEAAQILLNKSLSFRIDIVGDGPERKYFEDLAHKYNLLNRYIFFHGFQLPSGVAQIIAQAHCFVLNSNYEGLPCVLLEAMACGLPVISTKVGAVPEIIDDGQGIVINPGKPSELSLAMQHMMDNFKQYNAKEIRERMIKKYSYASIANEFDSIFKTVLDS